ncbi:MAG: dTDP-glucose 4,6-dehydratase [Halorientalis sp.]
MFVDDRHQRLLVTGGAGFIGSNFVRYALDQGCDVVTLDALTYAGSKANLDGVLSDSAHEFVEGDITDQTLVSELVADVDAIVNFAAESHVDRSIQNTAPFVDTNVEGTRTLLEAARNADVDRFLQVSTDEVYGETVDGTFSETDPVQPRNPYAASKAGADLLALSYHETYGVPVVVTRSSNNFGPRQHPEKLVPKFITNAVAGEPLPVYGDGTNVREWTFVTDNCRALATVLDRGGVGEVYNVGSGIELSNLEMTERIIEALDCSTDLIEFVEDRPGHDQRYALDSSKIRELGWEPEYTFADGLAETIAFYTE